MDFFNDRCIKRKKEIHGADGQNKHNWYPAPPKEKKGKELRKEMKEQEHAKDQDKSKKHHHKDHHKRHHNRKTMKLEDNTKPKRK